MDPSKYLRFGWALLPLVPGEKRPLTRHGVKDASTDPDQITAWMLYHPTPNIGVAGGNGLVIIDADGSKGLETARGLHLPPTVSATTPRGRHWYFRSDQEIRCSKNRLGPGIDVRGIGGYVVAPPSVVKGRRYRWRQSPFYMEMAELPAELAAACTVSPAKSAHTMSTSETVQDGCNDQSRSGLDAKQTIHFLQIGTLKPELYRLFQSFSLKYQEKVALYGQSSADKYFESVYSWAERFTAQGRVRVQVISAALEVLGAVPGFRDPLARAVLQVADLRTGEVIGVTVALESEMFRAIGLDSRRVQAPGGDLVLKRLVGKRLQAVIRGGRVLRLSS